LNITKYNINLYKNFGELRIGINFIPIELLSKGSHNYVEVKCDNCGKINSTMYKSYLKFTNNMQEKYYCKSCNNIKVKKTNLERYGVECNSQLFSNKEKVTEKWKLKNEDDIENIQIKRKQTNLEKYGVEDYFNDIKYKETCLNKYGVDNISKLEDIKKKVVETKLEKFGYINNSQCIKNKEKVTEKWKNKTEEELNNILDKRKIFFLGEFGYENFSQTPEYKQKYKKTCLDKYGFEFSTQSSEVKERIKKSRILKGIQISDDKLTDWEIYQRKVTCLTNKIKKELFEKWNGYDYYDNEYIQNNFDLGYIHVNYPTIDHKISTFHGFENNITPEEISNIGNLCITKRKINSSKNRRNQY